MLKPEELARQGIDAALVAAGWVVQDYRAMNLYAGCGVAVREFSLTGGHGFADYLLFVDRQAAGAVEAKKQGMTLTGVEIQSAKYGAGLPEGIPAPVRPLPFLYESIGIETRFTSRLDPEPRSRRVFNFHKPETLGRWIARHQPLEPVVQRAAEDDEPYVVDLSGGSRVALRKGLQNMPPIVETGL